MPKLQHASLRLAALLAMLTPACAPPLALENRLLLPELRADSFPGLPVERFAGELPVPGAHGPVWLIGIDGLDWRVAKPLIAQGKMPSLARFVTSGSHGELLSEAPTISPALWATIATGMPRRVHGVVNFVEKRRGSAEVETAGPLHRRSPALWELVGAAGGESTVVAWFGSYPAERIFGEYVSKGYDPATPMEGGIQPLSIAGELELRTALDVTDAEREAIGRTQFLNHQLDLDASDLANLHALLAGRDPQLVALHLSGIDVAQHLSWNDRDPLPDRAASDPHLAGVIDAYYGWMDRQLGLLLDAAPQNTTMLVVSDHGGQAIGPVQAVHLRLENLLEQMDLLSGGAGELLAISELYRNEKRIWLNVSGGGVEADDVAATARRIEARLRGLETEAGLAFIASITNHLDEDGWDPESPAFTLIFADAALTALWVDDEGRRLDAAAIRLRHDDVSGGHRIEGVIAALGPNIRVGSLTGGANQYQIAPTVLHLLGLPQDERMLAHAPSNGGVLLELSTPAWLAANPVLGVESYEGTDRHALLDGLQASPNPRLQEELESLRALGYVE